MKNVLWVLLASGFTLATASQASAQPGDQPAYVAAQRSAHQTWWQRLEWETNRLGEIEVRTNEFVTLATGLNFYDSTTEQWQQSREEWEVYPDAIVARAGRHKVLLPHNLVNGVDVLTADGVRLVATPVSLGFYDPVDGKQMVIAEVKDCAAERGAAVNEIVYRNCFDRIQGSIRYLYTLAGVHQHVVLEQQLQLPADFSDRTRLEVYTEFAPDTPAPGIKTRVLRREKDPVLRATMVEPDFTDSEISFGEEMRMRAGKAFRLGTEAEEGSIRVGKQFQVIEGRRVLIEAVEFRQLEPLLARLAAVASPKSGLYAVHSAREIKRAQAPVRGSLDRYREASKEQQIELASHPLLAPAVVVDWELLSDSTLTLKGDTCYFVTNVVNLTFPVLEGGVVIKLATNGLAQINLYGGVDCRTGPYRPAIFTVQSDNTVGEVLPGSTGVPATVNHGVTLDLSGEAVATVMENVRFAYLGKAFSLFSGNNGLTTTLRHAQFVQCPVALHVDTDSGGGVSLALQNVLAQSCGRFLEGFVGEYETHEVENVVTAEHLTVHECGHLTYQNSGVSTVALTNSLLVGVTNWGNWNSITTNTTAYWAGDPGGIFQTVGAASHYLADDTYRNAGTTNITADLLAALKSKTTYPPILISTNITADTVLAARPIRVTNAPALGCLYDPLDYVVNGRAVSATLTLTNGVALGTYGAYPSYGICLVQNGELISEGSPVALNRIVRYNTVQEQANTNWQSSSAGDSVTMTVEAPVRFRFTAWALPGGNGRHFTGYGNMSFRDCQFAGGTFYAAGATCGITNCLWERVQFAVYDGSPFHFYNNLVRGGNWTFSLSAYNGIVRDNLFDGHTPYDDDYPVINDHNGYVNSYPLPNSGGSDETLTNANYQTGPLGRYYYPGNDGNLSRLFDKGSSAADDVGLYHYTTTTNQVKETNSIVDVGFHYVALDTNGVPFDTNGNGIPDYCDPESTPRTDIVWSNGVWQWKANSLAWNCWTNALACTNGAEGDFYSILTNFWYGTANRRNTNFWMRHFKGWPAYSVWNNCDTNLWPNSTYQTCSGGSTWHGAGVLVSPEHVLTTGHMGFASNKWLVFLDLTNNAVFRQVKDYLYKSAVGGEPTNNLSTNMPLPTHYDYYIGLLDQPVPDNIGFVRVIPTNWWAWFDAPFYNSATNQSYHVPLLIRNCQHRTPIFLDLASLTCSFGFRVETFNLLTLTNWNHDTFMGGDSGSPWFLTLDGELCLGRLTSSSVNFGVQTENGDPAYMQACINAAMSELSLRNGRTSIYSLTVKDLSKYPIYRESYNCPH